MADYGDITFSNQEVVFINGNVIWVLSASITLPESDDITLSDYIVKSTGLPKSDSITLSDSSSRKTGLNKTDGITLSDSFSKVLHYNKSLDDIISLADNSNFGISGFIYKAFDDSILLTDNIIRSVSKAFGDDITLSDDIAKVIAITLTESLSISDVFGRNITLSIVNNNTINFEVTNASPTDYVIPYCGTVAGVPVYGNGYFTENIISIENPFVVSFAGTGSVSSSHYIETDYYSFDNQTELLPIWQMLLVLYATFMGLFKDKRYNASRMVEAIYRGELAYLKQLTEVKPDSKSDWTYK